MSSSTLTRGSLRLMVFASVTLTLAAIIGLSLYYTLPPVGGATREDSVVDCIPEGGGDDVTEGLCGDRGCSWQEPSDGAPWCTFSAGVGYQMVNHEEYAWGHRFFLERLDTPTLFGNDLEEVIMDVDFQTETRIRIKIYDPEQTRYQVPEEAVNISKPQTPPSEGDRLYKVEWSSEEGQFGVKVIRNATGTTVFDTTLPGLTFSDQYLQLTTHLPSSNMYGMGEHNHKQYKHDMDWRRWSIFTRDVAPVDDWNLYGAQPMYMVLEEDGHANGLLFMNSNAMDIVLQPDPYPAVSFRTIGGILDFYIYMGPTPENIAQQHVQATGMPAMVPYWSLGFQLSRWDYSNLTHVKNVVDRNLEAGIPQDVQYGDIDYMESKHGFTYDRINYAGLPGFVDDLHTSGKRYIIILDNFIGANETIFETKLNGTYLPYTEGICDDIFIKDPRTGEALLGEVWPGLSVYPDFTLGEPTKEWWKKQCEDFYYSWGVKYDALWIDMNEPSNFVQGSTTGCEENSYNYPPYVPNILGAGDNNGMMFDKTICMDAPQGWGLHYDVHSLYGHSHSIATYQALNEMFPGKRPSVFTRSNFIGTQKYAMHWLGDNQSQWPQMAWSIVGMLEYSLFGFPYIGADICGFWYAATEEMCQRWHQVGAFYPFARNHNAETWPDQDPAAFSEDMIRSTRNILLTRYKLLPYLYTLMHEAHAYGNTVVRPLMHEFVSDRNTWTVDTQFLWGAALLISPALNEGQRHVSAYIPNTRWYNYFDAIAVELPGEVKNFSTPLDKINLHVRGGHIMPYQEPGITTVLSRQNAMGLLVALGDAPNFAASGSLFWDDGESHETYENGNYLELIFTCENSILEITQVHGGYTDPNNLVFDTIDIWGMDRRPATFTINGTIVIDQENVEYDSFSKAARISNLGLAITDQHTLEWDYEN